MTDLLLIILIAILVFGAPVILSALGGFLGFILLLVLGIVGIWGILYLLGSGLVYLEKRNIKLRVRHFVSIIWLGFLFLITYYAEPKMSQTEINIVIGIVGFGAVFLLHLWLWISEFIEKIKKKNHAIQKK